MMLTTACTIGTEHGRLKSSGSEVQFNVITYAGQPDTRTAYSGIITDGKERIDWVEGDRISIFMQNSSGTLSHDYAVGPVKTVGASSQAEVSAVGGTGLAWGESGQHEFTAWYPSPEVFGSDDIYMKADGGFIKNDVTVKETVKLASAQLVIPTFRKDTLRGNVFVPDMRYAWMYVQTTANAPASQVDLGFAPAFNCFHITLHAGESALAINQVRVNSDSRDLAGKFTLDKTTGKATAKYLGYPATRYSAVKTENADGSDYVLAAGQTLEVTIFTIPDDFEDCSVQVLGDFLGDGTLVTKMLALKDGSGNGIKIKAGNKYEITAAIPDMVEIDAEEDYIEWAPQPLTPAGYVFSVSDTRKVRFTTANLAYLGATGGDKPWRIMKYPMDYIEGKNSQYNQPPRQTDDMALFPWATSGYSADPWANYSSADGYGPSISSGKWPISAYDWGSNNIIYNWDGSAPVPNLRVLTAEEWRYLLNPEQLSSLEGRDRNKITPRFLEATVNGIHGLIIFPDGFTYPGGMSTPGRINYINLPILGGESGTNPVSYTLREFSRLADLGAVFLPSAGYVDNGRCVLNGAPGEGAEASIAAYWSSTATSNNSASAVKMFYYDNSSNDRTSVSRSSALAVRLVQEVSSYGDLTPAGKTFTVSADGRKVQFTTANLMYAGASDPDPKTGLGKFKMMPLPWYEIEEARTSSQGFLAQSSSDDIGLFGWATSGYAGKNPWMASTTGSDYGPSIVSGSWTLDRDKWDWSQFNTVYASDGETVLKGLRTLTIEEWNYLLNGRGDTYRSAIVRYTEDGSPALKYGMIICPDGANPSNELTYSQGTLSAALFAGSGNHTAINVTKDDLEQWMSVGYVYLPLRRHISDFSIGVPEGASLYWSSSADNLGQAWALKAQEGQQGSISFSSEPRYVRSSVRLVKEITD